jgi:hypothetical protein
MMSGIVGIIGSRARQCYSKPSLLRVSSIISLPFSTKKEEVKADIKHTSAGMPEFLEHWNRGLFKSVGYGLAAASLGSACVTLPFATGASDLLLSTILTGTTAGYWYLGLEDINQSGQTIRRNFPVLGRMRYILESIRPEIRQYFM